MSRRVLVKGDIGQAVGTVAGAQKGAAAGAALGSVVPGIGTLIGGIAGGLLGAKTGGKVGDALTGGENITEKNNQKDESFTDKIKERGKQAIEFGQQQAQLAQQKQSQMQQQNMQMAEKAKQGSQINTGEPMDLAWRMMKGKDLKQFLQEYPGIKFQSQDLWDDPFTDEPISYGTTTHGKTSHLSPNEKSAAQRTMNPQRMAVLQRFLERGKAKNPTIIQQVHNTVEDPYFLPYDMQNPPMRTENSVPRYENEWYYETADHSHDYPQEQVDEFNRRYNIQQGEPIDLTWRMLKGELQLPHQITDALKDDILTLDRAHKMTDTNEGTLIENIHPEMENVIKLLAEKHMGDLTPNKTRPVMPLFHGQFD